MFDSTEERIAFALILAVFPLYHLALPLLRRMLAPFSTGKRARREVESWIRNTVVEGKVIVAVQQTRNTTMVASLLASSTLIILTLTASLVVDEGETVSPEGTFPVDEITAKALILFFLLAIAFAFFVQALNGMGRFTVMVGCEPTTLRRTEGGAVQHLRDTFVNAVRHYRVGIRHLHSVFPMIFWMFDTTLCIATTVILGLKFFFVDDFVYLIRKRQRPGRNAERP
ncbi:MAG: DUF599 domain-containing protein [Planctomycetota bacterium]|jgi:uncharacterized membrane protein